MLKCGQKENTNYTFGIKNSSQKEEYNEKISEHHNNIYCHKCGKQCQNFYEYCPNCGGKLN